MSHAPPPVVTPAGSPPAAETVIKGEITEDTLLLKARLDETERKLKAREMEHASVSDEFKRYKDATEARAVPIKREKIESKTKPFRIGRFV